MNEEKIQGELVKKFGFLADKIKIQRPRRMLAEVSPDNFQKVLDYLIKDEYFVILCAITGLDEGQTLGFLYHLAREDGIMINIKVNVDKNNPVIKTVTGYFPAADAYERELVDLLGTTVEGLPEGKRYPLPDDWPQGEYPLRKDWKKKEEAPNA